MSGRMQFRRLVLPVALFFVACENGMAEMNRESRAASALFGNFETVFYAKSDVLAGAYDHAAQNDSDEMLFPFSHLLRGLRSLNRNTSKEMLTSSDGVFVGAKEFRPPKGLGGVHSKRCYVIVLGTHSRFDLRRYFHQAPAGSAAGAQVWTWSAKLGEFGEEDPSASSFYAAQVADSYLLVSNNLEDLQEIANAITSSENPERVLARIRDWEQVSQHKVWGYRRYRHSGVVDREAAGMSDVTPGAEALIFFVKFENKVGVLRLVSSDTKEDAAAKMSAVAGLPLMKPQTEGIWETKFLLAGDEESFERLARVLALFGFGAYM